MPTRDPAKKREANRRWRDSHREHINAYDRAYRAADPERTKAKWREDNQRRGYRTDTQYNWEYRMRTRHGMTPAKWQAMFDAQGGRCYLCEDPLPETSRLIALDHDHSCCPSGYSCPECWRGLTCSPCNTAIGMARDDPDRLIRMAENLRAVMEKRGAAAGGTARSLLVNPSSRVATGYPLSPASRPRQDQTTLF